MSVVYFLALVGVLVLFHEFGHFLAAKLLNFKVTRFSLGFGRPLLSRRIGETEYRVSMFPLGGYVRIMGEDGEDSGADRRSFRRRPLWKRLVVVLAGPAANLTLPVLIYFAFFAGHSELPAAVVGDVVAGEPAAVAGVLPGDRIVAVDDEPVRYFEELEAAVQHSAGSQLKLRIERGGRTLDKYVEPLTKTTRFRDGRRVTSGSIGVTWAPFLPVIGVIDPVSAAGRAGLKTGDRIVSIDGKTVSTWWELERIVSKRTRRQNVAYVRPRSMPGLPALQLLTPGLATVDPDFSQTERRPNSGIAPAEMFVSYVQPSSPADLAGLVAGDLITHVDDKPINHWRTLDQTLQSRPDREFELRWLRASATGDVIELSGRIKQLVRTEVDELGNRNQVLVFGAHAVHQSGQNELLPIEGRISYALVRAVERTGEAVGALTAGLWAILRGGAASEAVGGPVTMYRAASVSGSKGWDDLFLMIALLSVSVGLINLLPIPSLDGGHFVVFAMESITRKPLTPRSRDRITTIGLAIIALFTLLGLRSDIIRFVL